MKRRISVLLALFLAVSAFALPGATAKQAIGTSDDNLVTTALAVNEATNDFDVLIKAVVQAGLAETLAEGGTFAVFAPTDAAFEALLGADETAILSLLDDASVAESLIPVLLYHVAPLDADYDKLVRGRVGMVSGDVLKVTRTQLKDATGGKAKILAGPVFASNGYIMVIDKVVIPG